MKKTFVVLLSAAMLTAAAGCSCNNAEGASSVQSTFTPSVTSQVSSAASSRVGADFNSVKFGVDGVSTKDWVSFSQLSSSVSYQFTLPVPPTWNAAAGSSVTDGVYRKESVFLDSKNRTIMVVKAPVVLKDGQTLPSIPGENSTAYGGTVISGTYIMLDSGLTGKLVTRDISADGNAITLYQYFIDSSDDIIYRAEFYLYGDPADSNDSTAVFNYIMSELYSSSSNK